MDPAIIAILSDLKTRNNVVVDIQTPAPRRWCPFRGGLTVAGLTYDYVDLQVTSVIEGSDGRAISCQLSVLNVNQIASPLVTAAENRLARVVIRRVWWDPEASYVAWAEDPEATQVGSEIWLDGILDAPTFDGPRVNFVCSAIASQPSKSPTYPSARVMKNHTPPAPGTKIGYIQVS